MPALRLILPPLLALPRGAAACGESEICGGMASEVMMLQIVSHSVLPDGRLGAIWAGAAACLLSLLLWGMSSLRARGEALRRRHLVSVEARLYLPEGAEPVRVTNLSRLGAQVTCPADVRIAADLRVVLVIAGRHYPARVAWHRTPAAGLAFDRRMDEPVFRRLTRRSEVQKRGRAPPGRA